MQPQRLRSFRLIGALMVVLIAVGLGLVAFKGFASDPNEIVASTQAGRQVLTIEWASTPAQREHGLMGRTSLPRDHGMLFDFGVEQSVDFWMKNTPLPLDMVFIHADGTVYRIERRTKPYSLDIIPGGAPVQYVLELLGGEADRIQLAPGDHIEIPQR